MKKLFQLLSLVMLTSFFVACSEENDVVEEFANWQETNEKYFNSLFSETSQRIAAGDKSWKLLRKWSLQDSVHANTSDYVIARVLEQGEGSSPLYTDSVKVIYSGRLLPSKSYPSGYVFDRSFVNDFNPKTAAARGFRVSSNIVDGFSTALQHMRRGDRWLIYVPSELGYGTLGNADAKVPAHSVLIFELMLKDIIQ